jgi:hypothetical protein
MFIIINLNYSKILQKALKMELCPSPNNTVVEPDERGKKLRTILHFLYYG